MISNIYCDLFILRMSKEATEKLPLQIRLPNKFLKSEKLCGEIRHFQFYDKKNSDLSTKHFQQSIQVSDVFILLITLIETYDGPEGSLSSCYIILCTSAVSLRTS